MNISVFGLGYVGSVIAACLAKIGHNVIGVDIKKEKTEKINKGKSPVFEGNLNELIAQGMRTRKLKGTDDPIAAIKNSEISLVCVGTPSYPNGGSNLDYIKTALKGIGKALLEKQGFHYVIIRSTILPGITEDVLIPILENESGKKIKEDFDVFYHPEFMREGSAIYDFFHPEFILVGTSSKDNRKVKDIIEKIYDGIESSIILTEIKTAEMIKYANNSFHGLKVAFANEIGSICKELGIDSQELMRIFCLDKKLNLSAYYLKPGLAFGGSCLAKDIKAITKRAMELGLNCPLLASIIPSNLEHIRRGVELIGNLNKRKIGIMGICFKNNTDDIRESPIIGLIAELCKTGYLQLYNKGYDIKIFDPNADLSLLQEAYPVIASLMDSSLENVLENSEVIVIGNDNKEFEKIPAMLKEDQILVNIAEKEYALTYAESGSHFSI